MQEKIGDTGAYIGIASLIVGLAAIISEEYRILILILYPISLTIWLLWKWSEKLELFNKRIMSLENEEKSNEKLLNTLKNIIELINGVKKR
ncbi:hypothetical protein HYW76_02395 [Candidatus Pacearchaeota archaeon]|nr:hypothetical protein [Candidatus Pacearchaeota archaeon]